MNSIQLMNKMATTLIYVALFMAIAECQMIFPGSRDFQASFVDKYENSPIDGTYSNGLLTSNIIPSYMRDNKLASGVNNFALNINKAILPDANNENVVLSPLSITGALALLLLGSVGQTYNEIADTLGFFNDISRSQSVHREFGMHIDKLTNRGEFARYFNALKPNISYGSAVFLDQDFPIRQQYEDFVKDIYRSVIRHVDYRNKPQDAKNVINNWVSDMTKGKISNILAADPPPSTRLILANALYFKAEWEKYFMDELTARSPFYLDKRYPQQIVKVDMMGNTGFFPFYKDNNVIMVGLPYKGNSTFMYAIKPADATKKDIKQIVNELTAESLENLIRQTTNQNAIVTFPKMKLTSNYNLRPALERLGIHSVFSSTRSNLALLSPVQNKSPFVAQNTYNPIKVRDDFLFTRFGGSDDDEKSENNCTLLFQNKNPDGATCTAIEMIDNKNVTVVYKQIDDKIGRRVINGPMSRRKRQVGFEDWNPGLYVDDVIHKVDMDITESGTEAAAATAVLITRDGRKPVFAGNEPFFFVIRDEETKIILFSTIVFKPSPNYK